MGDLNLIDQGPLSQKTVELEKMLSCDEREKQQQQQQRTASFKWVQFDVGAAAAASFIQAVAVFTVEKSHKWIFSLTQPQL